MPTTFKALVYADNKRRDGTYNVKIRVTHNRSSLKVSTNIYVKSSQLTRSLKIKDAEVLDLTDKIISRWRNVVMALGFSSDDMTAKQVVEYIKNTERRNGGFSLDFVEYIRKCAGEMSPGTATNYMAAANALGRFAGSRQIDIADVNAKLLSDFVRFLRSEPSQRGANRSSGRGTTQKGDRAVSLYLGILRAVHNRAKSEFNDEEVGIIMIPRSPFAKFKIPVTDVPRKRAISVELIQRIINIPDEEAINSRRNLARDCFLLSFGLAGMNAADLLSCPMQNLKGNIIVYNRQKTESRRADKAEMHIRIEPQIMPLVEKYRDRTGGRMFSFYRRYADGANFNRALNEGLKAVDQLLRNMEDFGELDAPEHITFYAARHSWATIARSSALKIDKYTVHEALNHVDSMKITDRYIERDWTTVWDANAAVVGTLDWSPVQEREKHK